jgi:hypothetical protein
MTPSTMYSPLMPLSRCFMRIIYLSTHLCFFPICQHLFEAGHGPHYTWLFFLAIPTARRSLYVIQAL